MKLFGRIRDPMQWHHSFAADLAEESGEHQFDLMNPDFESIILAQCQELKISRKQKKIIQFACRTQGNVEVLPQLRSSRSAAAFRDVRRNRKRRTPHLADQSIPFRFWKRGSSPVNAQCHGMAFLPDQEFTEVLHVSPFLSFLVFTYHLLLITYDSLSEAVQC